MHVAVAVIEEAGRYLITKRAPQTSFAGYWEFPGGKQEPDESLEACVKREVHEELGLNVTQLTPFMVIHHEYPDKAVTLHFFFCSISMGAIQPIGCADFCWVTLKELLNFSFLPANEPVVAKLREQVDIF